ncbi:YfiR family protein [Psychromonas sp. PT13]|uniref:YfiR family protein n=1 Tax=Psychromonas sp. PT13 TaxID=3439547 RepID=UPI003EBC0051
MFAYAMTPAFAHELKMSALKVAYIYNIAKFTNWPESTWSNASDPFHLCFYGDDQVSEEFIQLKDKQINGHRIELVKVQSNDDYKNCHIFYIDTDERRRYRYLLSLIDQHSVLVVTDNSPFFDTGGLINLVETDQRLQFQVSKKQLADSQLKFSSKLLKLAILVDDIR